jgi:sodium/bile acid cotransporter 7
MALTDRLRRFGIDGYMALLIGTVVLATVLPASGGFADAIRTVSLLAVALLFFLYGAKLDGASVIAGIANWRLQLIILATTFVAFPLLGLGLSALLSPWLPASIVLGLLFLAILPSTVQSSIAFTAMAQGNVAAAVCAASLSNVVGVVLTPALAALLLQTGAGGVRGDAVLGIAVQILLPFALGQIARRWIGGWVARHRPFTLLVDRGAILLIVYTAFSAGMVAGVWQRVDGMTLAIMAAAVILLLAVVIAGTSWIGRIAGLPEADRLALLFCGSTKSLASGVPMAAILFAGQPVSLIILPLMIFHQLQLFVCAIIAQRRAATLIASGAAALP